MYKKVILVSILLFNILHLKISAAPALDGYIKLKQSSGMTFRARRFGDEFNNWVEMEDGCEIYKNKITGDWEYYSPYIRKGAVYQEGIAYEKEKYSYADKKRSFGDKHLLVICIDFSDTPAIYDKSKIEPVFFGATSSVAHYYQKVSFSAVSIIPAIENNETMNDGVIGWLRLNRDHPNTGENWTKENAQIAKDAIIAADPFIDYSLYDFNGDNIISPDELSIMIIVAGYEESCNEGNSPSIWAHKAGLFSIGYVEADGKTIKEFAEAGERHNGHLATFGIMAHELGHLIFSLPDLYDTDPDNGYSYGVGYFDLMGLGCWASKKGEYAGSTPTQPSAWSKQYLSWGKEEIINSSKDVSAMRSDDSTSIYFRINTSDPNQYFLIENRECSGYDIGFQRKSDHGGLVIYHVDKLKTSRWPWHNDINADENNKGVDVEEANQGKLGYSMLDTEESAIDTNMFFFSSNNASFTDDTNPGSRLKNDTNSNKSILDVSNYGDVVTAKIDLVIDTLPPQGNIEINSGNDTTYSILVNLVLSSFDDSGVDKMKFSNDGIIWSGDEDYSTVKMWELSRIDGIKTVYVKFKDFSDNWSDEYSDTIFLDRAFIQNAMMENIYGYFSVFNVNNLPYSWYNVSSKTSGQNVTPTEIGFYMLSHIIAYEMDKDWRPSLSNVVEKIKKTIEQLETWRSGSQVFQPNGPNAYQGMAFYKNYFVESIAPYASYPLIASSVDNAWLAASLITIKEFAKSKNEIDLESEADNLLGNMDFMIWYNNSTKRFYKGGTGTPAAGGEYDNFSDEGRIINFIARYMDIEYSRSLFPNSEFLESLKALNKNPGENCGIVINKINSTGSYFSYLAPALFIKETESYYGSTNTNSVTELQIEYPRIKGYPVWGISDCYGSDNSEFCLRGIQPCSSNYSIEDGSITPYAGALGLITGYSGYAETNLDSLRRTYPSVYDTVYGFKDSVNFSSWPNSFSVSNRISTLSQSLIFMAVGNYLNSTVWKYFNQNGSVKETFEEMYKTFNISAKAGAGGVIIPSGNITMERGSSRIFTVIPSEDNLIKNVTVDNAPQGIITNYKFSDIEENHSIEVIFNNVPFVNLTKEFSANELFKVDFTAEASDYDGSIIEYEWDFDRNGVNEMTTSNNKASYTYRGPGVYSAKVTVTDNDGAKTDSVILVNVKKPVFQPVGNIDTVSAGSADRVDGHDLYMFAGSFGANPNDYNWNLICDFDENLIIDGDDLVLLSQNFGK